MSAAPPSILVVDDDADTCGNLADIFADLGYRVDTAPDGPAALELVRRRRYDVALLDLMIPGMDGASLYAEIKRLRAETVALVVTAYPGHPRAGVAVGAGVWWLLPKPVDFRRLLAPIDEAVGQPLVLVVDDDADLCHNLWDLLREEGYRVCLAHDAATAVERVREGGHRVVLLDVRLPDGDGGAVLREVKRCAPGTEVLLITGHRAEVEPKVREVLAGGASTLLYKPLDVPALVAALRQLTGGQAPAQEG
jgi:DNA-binding response OmpR family regulator